MRKIIAVYFDEMFELTLLQETESSYTCNLNWNKESRERYDRLYYKHEGDDGDYEFWYLNDNGDRLSEHELFEKSPWAIIEDGVPKKVICRSFGFNDEVRFDRGQYENEWKFGLYTDVEFDKLPNFSNLNIHFHSNLHSLWKSYNNNPNMTVDKISYTYDILNQSKINIAFSNRIVISVKITENKIRCTWDPFDVLLAYTLVKNYEGQPIFYNEDTMERSVISKEKYLKKVEIAFQKSDIKRA